MALIEYNTQKNEDLVGKEIDFSLIERHLYKMGPDEILCKYFPKYERWSILAEAHGCVAGGHYAGKANVEKVLRA